MEIQEESPDKRYVRYSKILGRGAFKVVYLGFDRDLAIDIAWNSVPLNNLDSQMSKEQMLKEAEISMSIKHPNIMKFYAHWVNNETDELVMITELLNSGTMTDHLQKATYLKLKVVRSWANQILSAIAYLHKNAIVHRDLKCDNIFINGAEGIVKVGDLGFATKLDSKSKLAVSIVGTPEFLAPEVYDEVYGPKVDVYAFGMAMLEMVTLEYPYKELNSWMKIMTATTTGVKPHSFWQIQHKQLQHFICLAISHNQSERPSAAQLLNHPFLHETSDNDVTVDILPIEKVQAMIESNTLPKLDFSINLEDLSCPPKVGEVPLTQSDTSEPVSTLSTTSTLGQNNQSTQSNPPPNTQSTQTHSPTHSLGSNVIYNDNTSHPSTSSVNSTNVGTNVGYNDAAKTPSGKSSAVSPSPASPIPVSPSPAHESSHSSNGKDPSSSTDMAILGDPAVNADIFAQYDPLSPTPKSPPPSETTVIQNILPINNANVQSPSPGISKQQNTVIVNGTRLVYLGLVTQENGTKCKITASIVNIDNKIVPLIKIKIRFDQTRSFLATFPYKFESDTPYSLANFFVKKLKLNPQSYTHALESVLLGLFQLCLDSEAIPRSFLSMYPQHFSKKVEESSAPAAAVSQTTFISTGGIPPVAPIPTSGFNDVNFETMILEESQAASSSYSDSDSTPSLPVSPNQQHLQPRTPAVRIDPSEYVSTSSPNNPSHQPSSNSTSNTTLNSAQQSTPIPATTPIAPIAYNASTQNTVPIIPLSNPTNVNPNTAANNTLPIQSNVQKDSISSNVSNRDLQALESIFSPPPISSDSTPASQSESNSTKTSPMLNSINPIKRTPFFRSKFGSKTLTAQQSAQLSASINQSNSAGDLFVTHKSEITRRKSHAANHSRAATLDDFPPV